MKSYLPSVPFPLARKQLLPDHLPAPDFSTQPLTHQWDSPTFAKRVRQDSDFGPKIQGRNEALQFRLVPKNANQQNGITVRGDDKDMRRLIKAAGESTNLDVERLGKNFFTVLTKSGDYFIFNSIGFLVKHFPRKPFGMFSNEQGEIFIFGTMNERKENVPENSLEYGYLSEHVNGGSYDVIFQPDGQELFVDLKSTQVKASEPAYATQINPGLFIIGFTNALGRVQVISMRYDGRILDQKSVKLDENEQAPIFDTKTNNLAQKAMRVFPRTVQIIIEPLREAMEARSWFPELGEYGPVISDEIFGKRPSYFHHPAAITQDEEGLLTVVKDGHNTYVYDRL